MPRLRFSLLSLLTFVLLIASAAALWWNWGPWVVSHVIVEEGHVLGAEFTRDESRILTRYVVAVVGANPEKKESVITLRDANTGAIVKRWHDGTGGPDEFVLLSPDEKYIVFYWNLADSTEQSHSVLPLGGGPRLDFSKVTKPPTGYLLEIADNDQSALLHGQGWDTLVRLPEVTVVSSFNKKLGGDTSQFLSGGKQLAHYFGDEVEILSAETGKVEFRFPVTRQSNRFMHTHLPGKLLIYNPFTTEKWEYTTLLYDTATGKELYKSNEAYDDVPDDTDGTWMFTWTTDKGDGKEKLCIRNLNKTAEPLKIEGKNFNIASKNFAYQNFPVRVWETKTGRLLWQSSRFDKLIYSRNSRKTSYAITSRSEALMRIVNVGTGKELLNFETVWHSQFSRLSKTEVEWMENGIDFMTHDKDHPQILIWKKIRPEQWYGAAWLPEFWLTLALAAAFIWSLSRHSVARHSVS